MVTLVTAPAHPHATGVAVYPALLLLKKVIIPNQVVPVGIGFVHQGVPFFLPFD